MVGVGSGGNSSHGADFVGDVDGAVASPSHPLPRYSNSPIVRSSVWRDPIMLGHDCGDKRDKSGRVRLNENEVTMTDERISEMNVHV